MALTQTFNLKHKILITEKTLSKDEYGQATAVWKPVINPWADVENQYLRDYITTIGTVLEGSVNFIIRYDQKREIDNSMRVVYKGKTYEIIKILPDDTTKEFTVITAKEIDEVV